MKSVIINNIKFQVITETELGSEKTLFITTKTIKSREEALSLKKYLMDNGANNATMSRLATKYQVSCSIKQK